MATADSSAEFALSPPSAGPVLPAGRPPPLSKKPASNAGEITGANSNDVAALWDAPVEPIDLNEPESQPLAADVDPADPKLLMFGTPRVVKPVSRAATPAPMAPPEPSVAETVPPPAQAKPPAATEATCDAANESEEESPTPPYAPRGRFRGLRSAAAFFTSMTVHMAGLIAASFIIIHLPQRPEHQVLLVETRPEPAEKVDTFELDQQVASAVQFTSSSSLFAASASQSGEPVVGAAGSKLGIVGDPQLDKAVVAMSDAPGDLSVESPLAFAPSKERLVAATPDGALGDPRAIVDNYDEAFDRITQEILWMLAKQDVLVVWCFDQSESMKDDQIEIRDRVDRVYTELGLTSAAKGEHLASAVTSFGQGFLVHTPKPVYTARELRAAIESVPVDPSGKEMLCQAVGTSISRFHEFAQKQNRQMALIVVTDESGERENNVQYLEPTLAAAKAAGCRIYVLGREAVFGYPYAHMSWKHPQTGHVHWLPIDRGPETGFVEQLQTDGFRRRYDAFNSGFGPYEQARLSRETGGIFFMLPSLETKLVRGEKRRYELEAMRSYRPDLRARPQLIMERDQSPLRSVVYKITGDLDPYKPEVAKVMEVDFHFPPAGPAFLQAAAREQTKAKQYLVYLDQAAKALESIRRYRDQEQSPRWQANFDLVYAQVIAYTARTYEYGAALDDFIARPKIVPAMKPGQMQHSGWTVQHARRTVGGDLTKAYIDRSAGMFLKTIEDHPGTPWAARAQWELDRGFGFDLHERYHYIGPRQPQPTPTGPRIPIPNL
jgi:hypothetical protein